MASRWATGTLLVVGLLVLAGCWKTTSQGPPRTDEDGAEFHEPLLEAARTYESFGRLNPALMRWAPTFCAAPPAPNAPAPASYSKSDDSDTHGQKVYSLFVKIRPDGDLLGRTYVVKPENPVGQVIVKESWIPEPVTDVKVNYSADGKNSVLVCKREDGSTLTHVITDNFLPYARKGDRTYYAAKRGPLFIMMKLHPATEGTDKGWVYGVVSPDGKEVQAAGRIASCMGCHEKAPDDRLFGPPRD